MHLSKHYLVNLISSQWIHNGVEILFALVDLSNIGSRYIDGRYIDGRYIGSRYIDDRYIGSRYIDG